MINMDLESEITTCLTPVQIDDHNKSVVFSGIWTKKGTQWYFQLDIPILQSMTAVQRYPLIDETDLITDSGFIIGWKSSEISLYISCKYLNKKFLNFRN